MASTVITVVGPGTPPNPSTIQGMPVCIWDPTLSQWVYVGQSQANGQCDLGVQATAQNPVDVWVNPPWSGLHSRFWQDNHLGVTGDCSVPLAVGP